MVGKDSVQLAGGFLTGDPDRALTKPFWEAGSKLGPWFLKRVPGFFQKKGSESLRVAVLADSTVKTNSSFSFQRPDNRTAWA